MEPASSDYLSLSDLSKPRRTPLQGQLEKIDPSIIKNGTPSSRSHRRGHARQRTEHDSSLFEISVLAFREIILKRLWKNDHQSQSETEFCKRQWDILKPRRTFLIECADLLIELSEIPIRPCSEHVCKALVQASISLQPSALQRISIAPELWQRVLRAWRLQHKIKPIEPVDVENISVDFVNSVLFPQAPSTSMPLPMTDIQNQNQSQNQSASPNIPPTRTITAHQLVPSFTNSHNQPRQQSHSIIPTAQTVTLQNQRQQSPQVTMTGHPPATTYASPSHSGPISQATQLTAAASHPTPATPSVQPEPFKERIAHLLTDQRRFHAPSAVLERVRRFFNGPPQLDPAAFKGSTLNAMIPVPFPEIMDTDGWRIPVAFDNSSANKGPKFAPIQSCFLHVPILPSKRRFETNTEVVLLDDVRLAGQLNAKLWEEFSNGNVVEAISLVPTSATWFGKTELADWPCVVMSGLKFEQANGTDPSRKKYSEVHSYIAVYLGRDPLRQTQFVQIFQDLGISPPQNPGASATSIGLQQPSSHRWIAGFRRLFRTQGMSSAPGGFKGAGDGVGDVWNPSKDDENEDSIDPQFDDIYSILPPNKKPRLERSGRPSDAQAAWHHIKRRKMEEDGFSKLKDQRLDDQKWGSDAEMSE